jgi:hypothetical protein
MNPSAWHLPDRQLLEDTPGWLNIDFSREVRLEKKLGEGGFGQVGLGCLNMTLYNMCGPQHSLCNTHSPTAERRKPSA